MLPDQADEGCGPSTSEEDLGSISAERGRPALPHQIAWTLAGNLSYAVAQWGMLVVLAKTVSPAGVGQFGLGLAIATPVLMLSNFQLRSLQATRASSEFHFADYLGFRLLSSGMALLVILAIALLSGYAAATAAVVIAVGFAKCVESVADTLYGHLQSGERMDRIAVSMVMKGLMSLIALSVAMWISHNVLVGVLALALAWLAVLLAYDFPAVAKASRYREPSQKPGSSSGRVGLSPRWGWPGVLQIGRLGLPLAIASLFLALASSVPRYFVEHWQGEEALGYFTALAYPTAAFSILLSAFGQAATPRMAMFYRTNRREYRRVVLMLGAVPVVTAAIAIAVLVAIGPVALGWLYRSDYAQFFPVLLILLGAGTAWSLASVLGYAATASGRLAGQAPVSGVVLATTLVASVVVIPSGGLIGAALVIFIGGATAFVSYLVLLLGKGNPGYVTVP